MRNVRTLFATGCTMIGLLMGSEAGALSTSGSISFLGPLADNLTIGSVESNTSINLYLESAGSKPMATVNVLASAFAVDTTFSSANFPPGGVLGPGLYRSFILHFDPVDSGTTLSGMVDFGTPILALITASSQLAATDAAYGAGVTYTSASDRGLDFGSPNDSVTVFFGSDPEKLSVSLRATTSLDHVRIITPIPEPHAVAILAASALTVALSARRRAFRAA